MVTQVAVVGWLVMAALCCIVELKTPGFFYALSFSLGALVAGMGAWCSWLPEEQMVVFFGASLVALFFLRLCVGVIHKTVKNHKTNTDALPGKNGVVTRLIQTHGIGQVRVGGELWSAQAIDDQEVHKGTPVTVVRVEGVRLIVKK